MHPSIITPTIASSFPVTMQNVPVTSPIMDNNHPDANPLPTTFHRQNWWTSLPSTPQSHYPSTLSHLHTMNWYSHNCNGITQIKQSDLMPGITDTSSNSLWSQALLGAASSEAMQNFPAEYLHDICPKGAEDIPSWVDFAHRSFTLHRNDMNLVVLDCIKDNIIFHNNYGQLIDADRLSSSSTSTFLDMDKWPTSGAQDENVAVSSINPFSSPSEIARAQYQHPISRIKHESTLQFDPSRIKQEYSFDAAGSSTMIGASSPLWLQAYKAECSQQLLDNHCGNNLPCRALMSPASTFPSTSIGDEILRRLAMSGSDPILGLSPVMSQTLQKQLDMVSIKPDHASMEGKSLQDVSSSFMTKGHNMVEVRETTEAGLLKRTRTEPTPPYKQQPRKEKLGDRITALQQLVSPFGKTDTASVLLEAIGYIKFLQEQVQNLSMPYMKTSGTTTRTDAPKKWNIHDGDSDEPKLDLRSRGLCLVPISATMQIANENGADYWASSFGTGYR